MWCHGKGFVWIKAVFVLNVTIACFVWSLAHGYADAVFSISVHCQPHDNIYTMSPQHSEFNVFGGSIL